MKKDDGYVPRTYSSDDCDYSKGMGKSKWKQQTCYADLQYVGNVENEICAA